VRYLETEVTSLRVEPIFWKDVKVFAAKHDSSICELVIKALKEYMESHP
jgi:predicted DNA-binding ribbon-helix-helix protein